MTGMETSNTTDPHAHLFRCLTFQLWCYHSSKYSAVTN